jgi:hypothetical protein
MEFDEKGCWPLGARQHKKYALKEILDARNELETLIRARIGSWCQSKKTNRPVAVLGPRMI